MKTSRDKAAEGLALIRDAIADVMRDHPGISSAQIQATLDLQPWQVFQVVARMMPEKTVLQSAPPYPCC